MQTIARTNILDQLANFRLPEGAQLEALLDMLEAQPTLAWVLKDVAQTMLRDVPQIREIGLAVTDLDDPPPIVWVEGYTGAAASDVTRPFHEFAKATIADGLYPLGIYNVNAALRFA